MNANPKEQTVAAFFALLDRLQKEHEAEKAQERKEEQDKRIKKLRPWWLEAAG